MPQDYRRAAACFQHSAELGEPMAEYDLGLLYERGLGVHLDYVEAYKWLSLASSTGSRASQEELKSLSKIMTPPQIGKALLSIAEWKATHGTVSHPSTMEGEVAGETSWKVAGSE
jgi:TPR repeat protein